LNNKQEDILDLYYNKHLKQNEIAKIVGTSNQYVSKIVKADFRYKQEKENRKTDNAEKRKQYLKDYFENYDRPKKKKDNSYEQLQALHEQASRELSYTNNNISDYAFAKCNPNAYHRNSKGNLVLVKGLKVGADVPKSINMNIKVPTQKYKQRCCFTR
jgi:predicted DNA-binding protein YlxM (UPF0122 family)